MYIKAATYTDGQGHYTYGHTIGPETHGPYSYVIKVTEGYTKYTLQNLNTKIEREIKGIFLYKHSGVRNIK